MDSKVAVLLLILGVSRTLSLHIVISPEEASKIMKRDDEFSKGLAGFIDKTLNDGNHVEVSKRGEIDHLKSLIQKALNNIDDKTKVAKKGEDSVANAPPALPLDATTTKDIDRIENLVNNMLDEATQKQKRQGWVHYGKKKDAGENKRESWVHYGGKKEADEQEASQKANVAEKKKKLEAESRQLDATQARLESIYEKVKRLVSLTKGTDAKDSAPADEVIVSDSGNVGSKMLAHINKMIAERNGKDKQQQGASNDIIDKLNDLSKRLTEENIADSNVGTLTLNAIKRLVAERAKNDHEEVKSHPRSKAKDQVTVDSLMGEISGLLRKLRPKAGRGGEKQSEEAIKTEVAVESKERSVKSDKRKKLLADLIHTYDALVKEGTEKNDAVEEELEKLSNKTVKRNSRGSKESEETAKAISGFNVSRPK